MLVIIPRQARLVKRHAAPEQLHANEAKHNQKEAHDEAEKGHVTRRRVDGVRDFANGRKTRGHAQKATGPVGDYAGSRRWSEESERERESK